MSVAAAMAPIASRQYGLAHLRQLRQLGVTREALRSALRTGEVVRVLPEVFRVAGAPPSWRQDLMAAVLDAGAGAAVSHRSAAILLGIARRNAPDVVEITVPRSRYSRSPQAIVHRSGDLVAEHLLPVDGIPCTGPLRTLVDLGAVEPAPVVSDALERALQSGRVTVLGAEWMLTELSARGRSGCGVFRAVLDRRALRAASPDPGLLEPRMARIFKGTSLPAPEYQWTVVDEKGDFVATPDFAYPRFKEAIEVDGFEAHGTPDAMTSDFEREHRLRAVGWNVTRFTWHHVVRQPNYVLQVISRVLRAHEVALQP